MKLSRTLSIFIAVAVGACAALLGYVLLFSSIRATNTEISMITNQLDFEVRKDQRLHSVKQLVEDLDEEFAALDDRFVPRDGVVGFLEHLEALGRLSGAPVGVNSVSVESRAHAQAPDELLRIQFVAQGQWSQIVQLLSLVETLPLSVAFDRVQIESLPSSKASWQANVSFSVAKLK